MSPRAHVTSSGGGGLRIVMQQAMPFTYFLSDNAGPGSGRQQRVGAVPHATFFSDLNYTTVAVQVGHGGGGQGQCFF